MNVKSKTWSSYFRPNFVSNFSYHSHSYLGNVYLFCYFQRYRINILEITMTMHRDLHGLWQKKQDSMPLLLSNNEDRKAVKFIKTCHIYIFCNSSWYLVWTNKCFFVGALILRYHLTEWLLTQSLRQPWQPNW